MSEKYISKQSIKQICNGFECFEEAINSIEVPVGDKAIVLEVCEGCLLNFVEDKYNIKDYNIQTNTNRITKNKVVKVDSLIAATNQPQQPCKSDLS